MNYFDSVEDFYVNFYKVLDKDLNSFFDSNKDKIKEKNKHPVYSLDDIKFRLVRDIYLNKSEYEKIMFTMFKEKKFNYKDFSKQLFFHEGDLKLLDDLGHFVGLHSHNHPMMLEKLNYDDQKNEYEKCLSLISSILDKPKNDIKFMSHPCGSYNKITLEILSKLGIELGFKQIMKVEPEKGMKKINNSYLEIARQNHSELIKRMS